MTTGQDAEYKPIFENVELVNLHEFSLILNSTHDIREILQESARAIREFLSSDGCHILLTRQIRDELHLETAIHDGSKQFPSDIDETKGISATTYKTGQIIVVKDAQNDPRVTRKIFEHFGHKSLVSAPIIVKNQIIGSIVVYSCLPAKYNQRDGEFLIMLGNHLGLAVQNAQLIHQIKKSASIDPLTKAFNRGYFKDELDFLLGGTNTSRKISLVMIDVNDLKVINDTYGHTMGDFVLQEVTKLIMQNVRNLDIVTRYGGDEFALILPDTDIEEANFAAQRIAEAIAGHEFKLGSKQTSAAVSWGAMSTNCGNPNCINELIEAADIRLYHMKKRKFQHPDEKH